MARFLSWIVGLFALISACGIGEILATIPQPKAPNFQYFERPKYRYPYYDENGRGRLLYGYGGPELYQYKTYSALEGIH
ncbi:uncharacterized protein LOC124416042 [Diprion similis]|uniref:uncharacterized protein LOC124416042 n=1 Tax=Diprion similis TaxID=362088 RepID=UPI001EF9A8D2|nr:uncharacterized protein LOC124416042 [Diprion similis]